MRYEGNKAVDVKIAYIGGGSQSWAWGLMSDLAVAGDISGAVDLYDIDLEAAKKNEIIGNKYHELPETTSEWNYRAVETIGEALTGADFVVISILPGTFDEMESDVHCPEKFGIYQSVGDTTGPGGVIRAMRTVPMFVEIAEAIKKYAPKAWVINYTNPMTLCVATLYAVFPQIKAFGCCHEVFGVQSILATSLRVARGIENVKRDEIKIVPTGVNHFTWITKAQYRNIDVFDVYREITDRYHETGMTEAGDTNWMNDFFKSANRVKFDLFRRYGYIAAAGDRHLAEFCPGDWYLKSPEEVTKWKFGLTPVSWRKERQKDKIAQGLRFISGEERLKISETGEDGVKQMRALLGLCDLTTNVNVPNYGQIPNLPLGAIVETNAVFTSDTVTPIFTGPLPATIYPLVSRISGQQQNLLKACLTYDREMAFQVFVNDPLVRLNLQDSKKLFDEMVENTKKYLPKEWF